MNREGKIYMIEIKQASFSVQMKDKACIERSQGRENYRHMPIEPALQLRPSIQMTPFSREPCK
jgi:hypothetical protein